MAAAHQEELAVGTRYRVALVPGVHRAWRRAPEIRPLDRQRWCGGVNDHQGCHCRRVHLPVVARSYGAGVGQKFSKPKAQNEDMSYSRAKNMLNQLGLQNYEKNFKNGLLTDETLPLLNDRYMLCILN